MKTLFMIMVVQSLNLVVFMWFNRVAWARILALRQQLTVYKLNRSHCAAGLLPFLC